MKQSHLDNAQQDSEDRLLLERVAIYRDRHAMERLYLRFRSRLGAFLFRVLKRQSLVDEIYNDVMLVVWRKADQYNGSAKLSTWLFSIAYRTCLKRLDKERKYCNDVNIELASTVENSAIRVAASETSFESNLDQRDLVQKALDSLSLEQRTVIELTYFLGNNYAEIAEITATPENTVKTRMFYARKKLQAVLLSLGETSALKNQ